jgi:hypothetical protein
LHARVNWKGRSLIYTPKSAEKKFLKYEYMDVRWVNEKHEPDYQV